MTRDRWWTWALPALLLLGGCADDGGEEAAGPALDAAAVCPGGVLQDGVVQCPRLQPEGDPLVLPADSGTTAYGALGRGGERFLTRDGARELAPSLAASLVEQVDQDRSSPADGAADDGDVAARTGPYAQLVYRAVVEDGTVRSLEPVVRVDETALLDRVLAGAVLEGTVSTFLGADEGFDLDPTLPVRLELAPAAQGAVLGGTIANATGPVRLSTGACAPALAAAGERDPLSQEPFSSEVVLQRFPSMHVPFDDELLLKWDRDVSNMGTELYPSAATLLGLEPLGETWTASPHGNPTAGPSLVLSLVEGGGGPC